MNSTEYVVSSIPFTIRRRVRFGECDPAGIVYTVRFSDFAMSAMDLFLGDVMGGERVPGVATPIKALRFVFSASLRPNDEFDMVVTVGEIRRSTFELIVRAARPDGEHLFEATVTPICITTVGERRSVEMPPLLRERLAGYQARLAEPAG